MGLPAPLYGYVSIRCCYCSVMFCLTEDLHALRRADHKSFFCPNGHSQVFGYDRRDEKIQELESELAAARQRQAWAESRAKGANIQAGKAKAELARTARRIHAGVCPHCHRTFQQLAAHMKTKHPGVAS